MTYGLPDSFIVGMARRGYVYTKRKTRKMDMSRHQDRGWEIFYGWLVKLGDYQRKPWRKKNR